MENKNAENNEKSIILDGLSSDGEIRVSEEIRDGKIEFTFESKKSGLVFEEAEASYGGFSFDTDTDTPIESAAEQSVSAREDEPLPEPVEPLREEFSIPDAFDAAAEEERVSADEAAKVWTTYVPRFTEVSETYRMNDDPRPRPEKIEKIVVSEEGEEPKSDKKDIDPTVEIEDEMTVPDAVVVNLSQKADEEEQSFSVYKFSESVEEQTPVVRERTVDDERREIERLVYRKQNKTDLKEHDEAPEAKEEMPAEELREEKKDYTLPDPEGERSVHVIDYASASATLRNKSAEAPDGAEDGAPVSKKGRITEYTAHMQRDVFKDKFLDSIMSVKIRFIAALIITFAMLLFENALIFNPDFAKLLNIEALPGAVAIADFHFALCVFVLALPEICRGFRHLVRGIVLPEITPVFSILVLFIYTLIISLEAPLFNYSLFGALFAVQGLAAILASSFKRSADFIAFKRASVAGEKRVLDKKMTRTLERENIALDGAVDEYKSKTARIFKTAFVSDFFKRSSGTVENSLNVIITLATALLASLIGAVIAFFVGNGWISAAVTFAAIALFSTPAVSLLLHKLPFYHSALECESEESAIIGESSIYDYSGVDVMAFEDTDIFGVDDVNLKRIIHYGDVDNMMKAMRQMSAVFANVGGPLDVIFSNALDKKCPPATSPEIEADGISGRVDGRLVCAGTAEYMLRHGIQLPNNSASARGGIADTTRIMYGAEDGVIYVQFHIRYSFSEEFTMILPSLKTEKIVPLIYTRDPNITGELLKTLTGGDDCIRVMKKNTVRIGEDKIYRRISAGIVTSGDKINALNVILLTKKYTRLEKKLSLAELVAVGSGTILSAVLAIAGALGASSLIFFGWQAIWCVALYIFSRYTFKVRSKENETDDE